MIHSKIFAAVFTGTFVVGPFIVWLGLYIGAKSDLQLRPTLALIRVVRWIGWILAVALFVVHLVNEDFHSAYSIALFTFSIGLSFPEQWVKKHFTPELIEPDSPVNTGQMSDSSSCVTNPIRH